MARQERDRPRGFSEVAWTIAATPIGVVARVAFPAFRKGPVRGQRAEADAEASILVVARKLRRGWN